MAERGQTACPAATSPTCSAAGSASSVTVAADLARLAAAVGTNFTLDLLTEASDLGPDAVVERDRRAVAPPDRPRPRRRLRLLARPAARPRLRADQPATALAAAPAHRTGDRAAEPPRRRRHRSGAGRAVRARAGVRIAPWATTARPPTTPPRMFAHTEAIGLYEKSPGDHPRASPQVPIETVSSWPSSTGWPPRRTRVTATPRPSCRRPWSARPCSPSKLHDPDALLTSLVSLWTSRFVQGRTADGYQVALRALAMVDDDCDASGPAHFAVGGSALSLGRPDEALDHLEQAARSSSATLTLTVGTRPDVHAAAWSAHAHWLLGPRRAGPAPMRRLDPARAHRSTTPSASPPPWRTAPSPTSYAGPDRRRGAGRGAGRPVRTSGTSRYYRDWGLVLTGWATARNRIRSSPPRRGEPEDGRVVRPHAVLAVPARGAGSRRREPSGEPRTARLRRRDRARPRRPLVAPRGDAAAGGARRARPRPGSAARRRHPGTRPRPARLWSGGATSTSTPAACRADPRPAGRSAERSANGRAPSVGRIRALPNPDLGEATR